MYIIIKIKPTEEIIGTKELITMKLEELGFLGIEMIDVREEGEKLWETKNTIGSN